LQKHGLSVRTYFPEAEVVAQSDGALISFPEALDKAVTAIKTSGEDIESYLSLARDEFGAETQEKMLEHFNHPTSILALVAREVDIDDDKAKRNGQWNPENGESTQDNWIFCFLIPTFSDHIFWSIVNKQDAKTTTYGFN